MCVVFSAYLVPEVYTLFCIVLLFSNAPNSNKREVIEIQTVVFCLFDHGLLTTLL